MIAGRRRYTWREDVRGGMICKARPARRDDAARQKRRRAMRRGGYSVSITASEMGSSTSRSHSICKMV